MRWRYILYTIGVLLLFVGVGVFGALVTNAMANVAAAALILPIVIPIAQLEGVDPTVLALCLGTATSFAMLLVIGCPPNAIAYSFKQFKALNAHYIQDGNSITLIFQ